MKKTKYIYKHYIYGGGPNGYCDGEVVNFYEQSGIALFGSKEHDYFYSWEYAGEMCAYFCFSHTEEVEVSPGKVTKIAPNNKYENGMNWKNVNVKGANSRLHKPQTPKKKPDRRPPINPKTGLRDGGI